MLNKILNTMVCTVIGLLWVVSPAFADQGDYQPYKPAAAGEQVSAPLYVVLAYSLIWVVLLGFVVSVWLRQRRVEAELDQLRAQLGEGGEL